MAVNVWGSRHNYFKGVSSSVGITRDAVLGLVEQVDAKGMRAVRMMDATRPNELNTEGLSKLEECVARILNKIQLSPTTPTSLASQQADEVEKSVNTPSFK